MPVDAFPTITLDLDIPPLPGLTETSGVETGGSEHNHCNRCRRRLKNPKYRKIGYGAVCLRKILQAVSAQFSPETVLSWIKEPRKQDVDSKQNQ